MSFFSLERFSAALRRVILLLVVDVLLYVGGGGTQNHALFREQVNFLIFHRSVCTFVATRSGFPPNMGMTHCLTKIFSVVKWLFVQTNRAQICVCWTSFSSTQANRPSGLFNAILETLVLCSAVLPHCDFVVLIMRAFGLCTLLPLLRVGSHVPTK